ncbi:hypothetical protein HMPREF0758_2633 [Serratia odorifera DSM 4582]|uniref:Uncharacterized protein n=1 Tax=Serratia odorifera DSM 4582 TaxID=667129 RepID=D4E383_SEROD|nr:hypothetical protein HMPREF0758_2633 [Serratia odorifera DSM 4582]
MQKIVQIKQKYHHEKYTPLTIPPFERVFIISVNKFHHGANHLTLPIK